MLNLEQLEDVTLSRTEWFVQRLGMEAAPKPNRGPWKGLFFLTFQKSIPTNGSLFNLTYEEIIYFNILLNKTALPDWVGYEFCF